MSVHEADDDTEAGPATEAPRAGRGPLIAAVAVALVLAVVAVVLALLLARGDESDGRLRTAAGSFGELLVTYDHRDPAQHRERVLEAATGSFASEYEEAFDQGLGALIEQLEATSRGFVKDVYTTEVQRGQALAIVVLDVETTGTSGPRRLFDVYVRLTMIEVDGRWLVDDVTDLSFGTGAGPAGSGGTEGATPSSSTSLP